MIIPMHMTHLYLPCEQGQVERGLPRLLLHAERAATNPVCPVNVVPSLDGGRVVPDSPQGGKGYLMLKILKRKFLRFDLGLKIEQCLLGFLRHDLGLIGHPVHGVQFAGNP